MSNENAVPSAGGVCGAAGLVRQLVVKQLFPKDAFARWPWCIQGYSTNWIVWCLDMTYAGSIH